MLTVDRSTMPPTLVAFTLAGTGYACPIHLRDVCGVRALSAAEGDRCPAGQAAIVLEEGIALVREPVWWVLRVIGLCGGTVEGVAGLTKGADHA